MSKKVLMINGCFRKRNTYNVLVQIGQVLQNHDIATEIINLFDYTIKDCTGCDDICIKKGSCHVTDDMPAIMQKIMDSDGIVLSSPVYLGGVTSKFKAFADRTNAWFHKPEPVGKPVLLVATTAVTGIKETFQFLEQFAVGFGARLGGAIARTNKNMSAPVQEQEVARFVSLLHKDTRKYRPSMQEIVIFEVQKVMALKSDGDDNRFWKEKDWMGRCYYYDCAMGPVKKAFSKMMFKILSKAIP